MNRRKWLKTSALGALAAPVGLFSPAIAQERPKISWQLASSFEGDAFFRAAERWAQRINLLSDGEFVVNLLPENQNLGMEALGHVENGAVEIAYTDASFYNARDPGFAFCGSLPFGMNARAQNAWWFEGRGREFVNEFLASYGLYALSGGNRGTPMAGWFRKEINSLSDFEGLKISASYLSGSIFARLNADPILQDPIGDRARLEAGEIDAVESSCPYDDWHIGFRNTAKFYYAPSFAASNSMLVFMVNQEQWINLPEKFQTLLQAVSANISSEVLAHYDAQNPLFLKDFVSASAQLRGFSFEILAEAERAARELYASIAENNKFFQKIYEDYSNFQKEFYLWASVAELPYDIFQARNRS